MRFILTGLFLTIILSAFGQYYQFDNYNNIDGLAQSQAKTMLQDQNGFIWIGTANGLSKFDSHEFVNYYKKDGLIDNSIYSLFEDSKKGLWVGMQGGISHHSGGRFTPYNFPEEIKNFRVLSITSIHSDTLILSTNGRGVVQFSINDNQFIYDIKNVDYVRKCVAYKDKLIIATTEGLFTLDANLKNKELLAPELKSISITDIEVVDENLWVSTFRKGVYKISDGKIRNYTEEQGLIYNNVRNIESNKGKIWFATIEGVSCFDGDSFLNLDASNGLENANIESLLSDTNGSLWLASKGQGIFRFTGWLFTTSIKNINSHSDIIMSICEDQENNLWLGSYGDGVAYLSPSDSLVEIPELGDGAVWSSLVDLSGKVWLGNTHGLKIYDHGEIRELKNENIFNGTRITSLIQDENQVIWIGHKEGLSSFDGQEFKAHGSELGIPIKRVRSIVHHDGILWVGNENGIYRFDGNFWSHFDEQNGLSDNDVNALAMDKYDRLWIGSKSGLDVMKDEIITRYDFKSRENDPVNILHLLDNQLMIGSNNGLHLLTIKENQNQGNSNIRHFNRSSGLPNLECNLNASYQTKSGNLYIGTSKGLVSVDVDVLVSLNEPVAPDVFINGIRIFMLKENLEEYSEGLSAENGLYENLILDYKDNHITFDFTAISFDSPEDVIYKYKLNGADADWLPPTASNFVTYSYLAHGDYTLELMAADKNGVWSAVPKRFSFSIKPPYYLTTWFLFISSLLVLAFAYLLYRWRKSVLKKKNETELIIIRSKLLDLEQQSLNSAMNRHFIFNALNSIQYYINREDKRSANTYLTNFAKLIRKNLDSTENNWSVLGDELERIELYLSMEHMRFKNRFEYKINISPEIDINTIEIPPMLFQPFLENSIWHGLLPRETLGTVSLDILKQDDLVKIKISDNGIGIGQSQINKKGQVNHDSKGVEIINNRIKLFGKMTDKKFEIVGPKDIFDKNNKCIGTTVEILMPIVQRAS
ncbi:MAG: ligand-binding sensor domain-containing protein [Patiriisocius sp.]|jgi:ligand-binding sensor domain-containing protein